MESSNNNNVENHLKKGLIDFFLKIATWVGGMFLVLFFLSTVADWFFNLGIWDTIKLAIFDFL